MIVRLHSGLGNQLFHYAFGRSVSVARDEELFFKRHHLGKGELRAYSLDPFRVEVKFTRWAFGPKYKETTFCYDPGVFQARAGSYFIGNWQTEKYFNEPLVRKDLSLRAPVSAETERVGNLIASGPSAFIHVRRTDYLAPNRAALHGTLGVEYYNEAMALIRKCAPKAHFFVFSDDPDWCRNVFPGDDFTVVSHNGWGDGSSGPGREHEDLWLMSRCDHAIIPNSTFGWWGAWLNPEKKRVVVAPKNWFVPGVKLDARDVLPERWTKI